MSLTQIDKNTYSHPACQSHLFPRKEALSFWEKSLCICRPVQFLMAGTASRADDRGKENRIQSASRTRRVGRRCLRESIGLSAGLSL